jgi:lactate dehydrogenase-like 2-hydroxyacid dehydrogenase
MTKNTVLVAHEQIGFVAEKLSTNFQVLKAWEPLSQSDLEAVRAIVVAGDILLEDSYLSQFPNLGLIACLTSGYDGVDVEWATAHGIKVSRAINVNHDDVADHAVGLLIAWTRGLVTGDRIVRSGRWDAKKKVVTRSLSEMSVGIVGMGAIGKGIASRCAGLGLPVFWWGPREKNDVTYPRVRDLMTLAREADVVFVASSADNSNRHLISKEVLEALGPDGLIINVARGSLVDEDALIELLRSGLLGGAALDVFQSEPTDPERWLGLDNVILTPHSAGVTSSVLPKLVAQLSSNLEAYFDGRALLTPIAA